MAKAKFSSFPQKALDVFWLPLFYSTNMGKALVSSAKLLCQIVADEQTSLFRPPAHFQGDI